METKIALTDYDDLGLVNCAECGRELVGERSQEKYDLSHGQYLFVFTRIGGRPYCRPCSRPRKPRTSHADPVREDEGCTTIYDAALRAMEDRG